MGSKRIALFDNIKGVLIVLVVFGHLMHPVHNSNPALSACFDVIYLFHMPLFVLVSGLFAKGAYRDGKLNVNRIISFFVLGFAFQLALAIINGARLTPQRICAFTSGPWYLLAMAYWYALTPVLAKLGFKRGMALSLVIALAWGAVDLSSGFLAISRTMAFLPCFALGYYLTPAQVQHLRRSSVARWAVAVAAFIVLVRICNEHAYDWFFPMVYGDNPYSQGFVLGVLQKLTALGIGAICSLAVLRLVPEKPSGLTVLGQRTLQIYILHRLVRAWLTFHTPLYSFPVMNDPVTGTLIVAALTAATIALCLPSVLGRPLDALLRFRWIGRASEGA